MLTFLSRAIVQQTRDLGALFIDFGLVFMGGLFLGLVFTNITYEGINIHLLDTHPLSVFCLIGPPPPLAVDMCPSGLQPILRRPINDPIPTEASLTCLSVSLVAVAAALRVFGPEKVIFWREASAGMSPLAYFIGCSTVMSCPLEC